MKKPTPPTGSPRAPGVPGSPQAAGSGAAGDLERALALRDVMDHAVKVQREITEPRHVRRSRVRIVLGLILCVPLLALCAYSWIAKPAFIWGTRPSVSPARRQANVRLAMFLVAQRLETHRAADGRYPASLADIGEQATGLSYRRLNDSAFVLSDSANGSGLVLRSDDRPDVFLGNAVRVIGGHAP